MLFRSVGAEVAQTHELVGSGGLGICQTGLHLTAGEYFQRVGVHAGKEVLSGGIGIRVVKEIVILPDLGVAAVFRVHPVDGSTLDLPAIGGVAPTGIRVRGRKTVLQNGDGQSENEKCQYVPRRKWYGLIFFYDASGDCGFM